MLVSCIEADPVIAPALFEDLPIPAGEPVEAPPKMARRVRVRLPNRGQIELRPSDLESLLPEGHRARIVWGFVVGQDLSVLYAGIKAVEGGAGRAAIAPRFCTPCGCLSAPWKAWAAAASWND